MSLIASFYLVKAQDITVLKELAVLPIVPVERKFLWLKLKPNEWRNPFWEFLHHNALKLDEFSWSGEVMLAVEAFLSVSIDLYKFADKELSDYLSKAKAVPIYIFNPLGAKHLAEVISEIDPASVDVFLSTTDETPDDLPLTAILHGLSFFKSWLLQVEDEYLGLLHIG